MRKMTCLLVLLCINLAAAPNSFGDEAGELAVFSFEQLDEKVIRVQLVDDEEEYGQQLVTTVVDEVSGEPSVVHGNFMKLAEGMEFG